MIPAERRQRLLDLISEQGTATIADLSNIFSVSEMTIHRDLKYLETSGHVVKTYGGVIANHSKLETDYERRLQINIESKKIIGKAAANLIEDGDSILIDACTTTFAMLPELTSKKNLTVFSTGVSASNYLARFYNIELYSTGGLVINDTDSYAGVTTINFLKNIHVDKCFIGAAGVRAPYGITDLFQPIVEVKQYSAAAANEVIVLADHSKFGRIIKFNILPFSEIDLIITDADKETPSVNDILKLGVEILFVEPNHT